MLSAILVFSPLLLILIMYTHFRLSGCKYWSKRNIPHARPQFFYGNFREVGNTKHSSELFAEFHLQNLEKKMYGYWFFTKPAVLAVDMNIIKRILIQDFSSFRDRGIHVNTDVEPVLGNLFFLRGKKWRNLRVKLTPTFTSGKMKMMFSTIAKCGQQLRDHLETKNGAVVEVKDLMARFTTDVISSCAFGLETNSLDNPESEFRKNGERIFSTGFRFHVASIAHGAVPWIADMLGLRFYPRDMNDFFVNIVREAIEYRERTNTSRKDFLQLIIQLMRAGKIEDADRVGMDGLSDEELVQKFSLNEAVAQCFVFFAAGFETSSSSLTHCLYELALNPDVQRKLHEEIDNVLIDTDGEITYDKLHSMEYMDKVVQETLRKHPPLGNLQRVCEKDYYIPELDATLEKGTEVIISVTGIHRNPQIYPEPDRFNPERFTAEEKAKRDACTFLAFGEGPRNCIGSRFGLMQFKTGLFYILSEYRVETTKTTPIPIKYHPKGFLPVPAGGVDLVFRKRD